MSEQEAFYPMPSFPTLVVRDLGRSTQWYQDAPGFRLVYQMPGPDGEPRLSHMRWARYADLLLVAEDPSEPLKGPRGVGITLSFGANDQSVDAIAERARTMGAEIPAEPANQPWNVRDTTIADPDGYRLTFFEPVNTDLTMDEVMGNIAREPER